MDRHILRAALAEALGADNAMLDALVALDPEAATRYLKLAAATRRLALDPKVRCFIELAVVASPVHLVAPAIRACIARALRIGASQAELLDVLRLASVLGVHSLTPAINLLVSEQGGSGKVKDAATNEARQRAQAVEAEFRQRRGFWPEEWRDSALLAPEFISAYSEYSSLAVQSECLPGKVRELILLAIDISPSHFHLPGATSHLRQALLKGATREEIIETISIAALIGFNTFVVAMPLLREELTRHEKEQHK
jgi:alkylhydroperoxidase/carboxymuconolactone decarboxylase family protein YurZ